MAAGLKRAGVWKKLELCRIFKQLICKKYKQQAAKTRNFFKNAFIHLDYDLNQPDKTGMANRLGVGFKNFRIGNKKAPIFRSGLFEFGAGNETRTRDPNLGKSYRHKIH
ncbi:hypothetical protein AB2762_09240 [Acinetobacter indicus]